MASGPLYLTLLAGPVEPVPVPKPVLDALVSAQVTEAATGRSGFELTFTLANGSPLVPLLMLAGTSPVPVLRVVLTATWGGLPQVLIDGVIEHQEVHPGASGSSRLVVKGHDLTALMERTDRTGMPYPGLSPDGQAAAILAQYAAFGVVPDIVPVPVPDAPGPTERIPIQYGSDFAYLSALAADAGYVFYLAPGPLPGTSRAYFGPVVRIGVPQPSLAVNMDAWTNVESLSFSYEPQGVVAPVVYIATPAGAVPVVIPATTPFSPPLGAVMPAPQQFPVLADTANKSPGTALMRGMAEVVRHSDVVTGTGTLTVDRYGTILRARGLVGVRGAGLAFDGLHYVDSVTHDIRPGEYKQSFTLRRNALIANLPVVPTAPY